MCGCIHGCTLSVPSVGSNGCKLSVLSDVLIAMHVCALRVQCLRFYMR